MFKFGMKGCATKSLTKILKPDSPLSGNNFPVSFRNLVLIQQVLLLAGEQHTLGPKVLKQINLEVVPQIFCQFTVVVCSEKLKTLLSELGFRVVRRWYPSPSSICSCSVAQTLFRRKHGWLHEHLEAAQLEKCAAGALLRNVSGDPSRP